MAVTINADNGVVSGSAGLKQAADSTGVLALQTNGTTAVSISTGQVVTLTQPLPVASGGTGSTTGVTPTAVSDQTNTSTGYFDLPSGTTAQRPGSPGIGMIRYNTDLSSYEGYTASGWQTVSVFTPVAASYLVIAGGGGGGGGIGGGGGAGGLLAGTVNLQSGMAYNIIVGAGGAGSPASASDGSKGNDSSLIGQGLSVICVAGGAGVQTLNANSNGGSGGGSRNTVTASSGVSGQGFGGGTAGAGATGSGGGGASAAGGNGTGSAGGAGGAGTSSSITGTATTYGGGGGGSGYGTLGYPGGAGGSGGGGAGASTTAGTSGTANTGGGGGGGGYNGSTNYAGGTGGSGVVFISVPTASYSGKYSGAPTITTSGSNTILKYTSAGVYIA